VSKASDLFSIYKLTDEDKAQILRLAADKNIGEGRGVVFGRVGGIEGGNARQLARCLIDAAAGGPSAHLCGTSAHHFHKHQPNDRYPTTNQLTDRCKRNTNTMRNQP